MLVINGLALDWFRSYLLERTQCIKTKDTLSDGQRIKMGCSAGICVRGIIVSNIYTAYCAPMAWTPMAMLMIPR